VTTTRRPGAPSSLSTSSDARRFRVRDDAVAWVRESLVAGDAVLYLNDLPDQYP